jgi:hypothetical protein
MLARINDRKSKGSRGKNSKPLRPIKSEYDELCDELGGPADIGAAMGYQGDVHLPMYSSEYPARRIVPVFLRFEPNKPLARRHWPWAAFAISQYVYEREARRYTDEPSPKELEDLLSQIAQSARRLSSGLLQLEALSNRLNDPTAPLRRAHIGWLDAFISQAAAGFHSNKVDESAALLVHSAKMAFIKRLANVEAKTREVGKRLNKKLLERERGQVDPALFYFVFRCGVIWKNITERKVTANKVSREKGVEPDFVIFVQELAKIGRVPAPTRRQVEMSLLKLRNPD